MGFKKIFVAVIVGYAVSGTRSYEILS